MSDRETRLRELLERRAESFPSNGGIPPGLLRRARGGMAVTGLVLSLVVAGLGFGAFAGVTAIRRAVIPISPTPSMTPVPSPSHTVQPSPEPTESPSLAPIDIEGVKLVLPLAGQVSDVAMANGSLYAAYTPTGALDHEVIARLDLQTGEVVETAPLSGRGDIAVAGGSLWAVHWRGSDYADRLLDRLDPSTLAVVATAPIPGSPSQLAPAPDGLWVGSGTRVYLLDPADGHVIRSVKLDGQVGAMSVDPPGRLLYVATSVPDNVEPRSLYAIDAATGAIRAKVAAPAGVAVTALSATSQGVWVTVATGLLGHVELHGSKGLHLLATYQGGRGAPVTNSIGAGVVGDTLWVTDSMIGVVACADPQTGKLRSVVIPQSVGLQGFSNIVGPGLDAFVGTDRGVIRITPSAACRG